MSGNINAGSPDHWRFLLGRHGRGINVALPTASARWVHARGDLPDEVEQLLARLPVDDIAEPLSDVTPTCTTHGSREEMTGMNLLFAGHATNTRPDLAWAW